MFGPDATSPIQGTLEALTARSKSVRRTRPPDVESSRDRIPLRGDMSPGGDSERAASKRDSSVNFRGMFSKSRSGRGHEESDGSLSPRGKSRAGAIRASLADISNWQYGSHSARADHPTSPPTLRNKRSVSRLGIGGEIKASIQSLPPPLPLRSKGSPTAWEAPPLFKAYPQAIMHAILPTCNLSVDTLLRLNGARNASGSVEDLTLSTTNRLLSIAGDNRGDKGMKKYPRTLSQTSMDWSRKIYVLVTTGYLLQYAATGNFDRSPEKILQLTKDSAAFASDLIPGRHWVLQVSKCVDADGTRTADSRSLFSKLSLRSSEKKHVSDALLVLESAEDMDSWLATLRMQIQAHGGRRKESETGVGEGNDEGVLLRTQPSQRTLVLRDPARFGEPAPPSLSAPPKRDLKHKLADLSLVISTEPAPDYVPDDQSTSESISSADGRRLDSLRDSGVPDNVGHRLSLISSGQRTCFTSAGSSPACSPVNGSFPSAAHDKADGQVEVRARPNAQAISSRRSSMQTMLPVALESRVDPAARPLSFSSIGSNSGQEEHPFVSNRRSIPNFSVPHSSNRRFSGLSLSSIDPAPDEAEEGDVVAEAEPHHVISSRKPPPEPLHMPRRLSVVVDQPSPRSPPSPLSPKSRGKTASAPSMFYTWVRMLSPRKEHSDSSLSPVLQTPPDSATQSPTNPRKFASTSDLQHRKGSWASSATSKTPSRGPSSIREETGTGLSPPLESCHQMPSPRRASRVSAAKENASGPAGLDSPVLPRKSSARRTRPYFTKSSLLPAAEVQGQKSLGRRSMPQLSEIPPPVPPPTRALPPIPKKQPGSVSNSAKAV